MMQDNLDALGDESALEHLGLLIDYAGALGQEKGLKKAVELSDQMLDRSLAQPLLFKLHYFLGNAWAGLRGQSARDTAPSLPWESREAEQEILHLRTALALGESIDSQLLCPALTNLGNLMSMLGRQTEAITYWNQALDAVPGFSMALGNRGHGLFHYASQVASESMSHLIMRRAHADVSEALGRGVEDHAKPHFEDTRSRIAALLSPGCLSQDFDPGSFPDGIGSEESEYRRWCLSCGLFLNPLNELGPHPMAAEDSLRLPSIVAPIDGDMRHFGMMNQIKQEFVSARWLLYEGTHADSPHFSDRRVSLANTLDYPSYCLAIEKVKAAFRSAYSILDKAAFFLNDYLALQIKPHRVSFRRLWYIGQERSKGVRSEILERDSAPLHALFWLAKDLYENRPGFQEVIEPEAQGLAQVRNHLEHKYLKLHESEWIGRENQEKLGCSWDMDTLAHSLYRSDFEAKALKLLKLARACMIYLVLAVGAEERRKSAGLPPTKIVPPLFVDDWDDDWKR